VSRSLRFKKKRCISFQRQGNWYYYAHKLF